MRRATSLFLLVCAAALSGPRAFAQPAEAPAEAHNKAYSSEQTFGPPPRFALRDVTVLLQRETVKTGEYRKVTLSGMGQTVYVQIKSEHAIAEKAETCPLEPIFAVLQEAYAAGFFRMGSDYTTRLTVEEEEPGTITTVHSELREAYPKVTLTVRIGDYAKTVSAVDGGEYADRYDTPDQLLRLADFIESRPVVAAIRKEIEK